MSANQDVNSKLFVLYLIDTFPGRTESDLVSLALSSLYLDYFGFHETLTKLNGGTRLFKRARFKSLSGIIARFTFANESHC